MGEREREILDFFEKNGPSLPADVAKATGQSILLMSAILEGMVGAKQLRKSTRRFGNSHLYFLNNQEEAARSRVMASLDLIESKVLDSLKRRRVFKQEELSPQERVVMPGLMDFFVPERVNNELVVRYYSEPLTPHTQPRVAPAQEVNKPQVMQQPSKTIKHEMNAPPKPAREVSTPKPAEQEFVPLSPSSSKGSDAFKDKIERYFRSKGVDVLKIECIKKGAEFNSIVSVKTSISNQVYFVKAKKKAKLNEGDLSLAWTEANQYGMPVIFLTSGKLTVKAEEFYKSNLKNLMVVQKF